MIDNRPGAGGLVGIEAAANTPADGYTVVMGGVRRALCRADIAGKAPLLSAFAPISVLTTVPMMVVTRPQSRFTDMRQVLAEAKAKPGTISIGHAGNGTSNHIDILRLQVNEKVQFNIIPYKGSGPGLADLMSGNLDLYPTSFRARCRISRAASFGRWSRSASSVCPSCRACRRSEISAARLSTAAPPPDCSLASRRPSR